MHDLNQALYFSRTTVMLIVRMAALWVIALAVQGCAPDTATDNAAVPAAAAAHPIAPTAVTAGRIVREEISVNDGVETRTVYEVQDGIKAPTLEENKKDGKLHGVQHRYAKGRMIEEVYYEDGKKVKVESQEWLDEMNALRSENCILEKTPDHADPEANDPPMSEAMLERWNARCNERPFARQE